MIIHHEQFFPSSCENTRNHGIPTMFCVTSPCRVCSCAEFKQKNIRLIYFQLLTETKTYLRRSHLTREQKKSKKSANLIFEFINEILLSKLTLILNIKTKNPKKIFKSQTRSEHGLSN